MRAGRSEITPMSIPCKFMHSNLTWRKDDGKAEEMTDGYSEDEGIKKYFRFKGISLFPSSTFSLLKLDRKLRKLTAFFSQYFVELLISKLAWNKEIWLQTKREQKQARGFKNFKKKGCYRILWRLDCLYFMYPKLTPNCRLKRYFTELTIDI